MKALLLAGGMGTRLKPLTNFLPKCLVPINGRPLLDYWVAALVDNKITEILLNTHYLNSLVEEYINHSTWSKVITVTHEPQLLGTGGTILKNKDFFHNDDFLVAHADNMFNFDLRELLLSHQNRNKGSVASMLTFYTDEPKNCGIVSLDKNNIVQKFDEKNLLLTERSLANAAIYIFTEQVYKFIENESGNRIDISLDIIPKMLGRISACIHPGDIIDIGSMNSWNNANLNPITSTSDFLTQNKNSWTKVLKSLSDVCNE